MAFTIVRRTPLVPEAAWSAVSDLAEQTREVPLTTMEVPPGGLVLGAEVVARTRVGPVGFADSMLVTGLAPGHRLRVVKTGRVLRGWAQITVDADPDAPGGARVTWTEELWLRGLRRLTSPVGDRLGPRLFGRILDSVLARAAADAVRPVGGGDR